MSRPKKYQTEEERKEARKKQHRESQKRWRKVHPEYYQEHKEEIDEYMKQYQKQYSKTPMGRAFNLLSAYQQKDKKYGRGECTLTAQWIVDNIFTKPCAHCGKTGWKIIGCNRIDNSLPHTPDNVEPCCEECNKKVSGGRPKKLMCVKK